MTQHLLEEHTLEDQRTMRRLALVIGGFIVATDRYGVERKFALMAVSIAAITKRNAGLKRFTEVAEAAADGKSLAKAEEKSSYVRDGDQVLPQPPR